MSARPEWERWHKSLRHDEVKSIGDAVEQLMYEAIEFGGDMGPNGNTYNGIDEGDVLTTGFITAWVERFDNMLGLGTCRMERIEDEKRILHGWMECSECGPVYPPAAEGIQDAVKFCPFCGRKVVKE